MKMIDFYDDITVIHQLIGKTLTAVEGTVGGDDLKLTYGVGDLDFAMFFHSQECCEDVRISQIDGNVNDLIGSPLTMAEVVVSSNDDEKPEYAYSGTWSFLKLATVKGYVTVRWLGESNGYYSETISANI